MPAHYQCLTSNRQKPSERNWGEISKGGNEMMRGDLFFPITDELQSAMHTNTHTHSHQISHRDSSANNAIDRLELLKQCGIIMTGENTYVFSMRVQTFKCGVYSFLCTFSACVIHLPILTLSEECCFKVQNGFSVPFQCNKLSQPLLNQSG